MKWYFFTSPIQAIFFFIDYVEIIFKRETVVQKTFDYAESRDGVIYTFTNFRPNVSARKILKP